MKIKKQGFQAKYTLLYMEKTIKMVLTINIILINLIIKYIMIKYFLLLKIYNINKKKIYDILLKTFTHIFLYLYFFLYLFLYSICK